MLKAENVSFSYGRKEVLKHLSFQADSGELVCVLGPNGVGKSTLFRCLLGILRDYSGSITVEGQDSRGMSYERLAQYIAYIPQSHTPVFNYSVLDVVMMGTTARLGRFSSPKLQQEKLAIGILQALGIDYLRERGYAYISGGERQLVLIARAMAQEAKILIMDEPTANLDYGNQVRVMEHISGLKQQGYTIILSTHNPDHAFLFSDRVLILKEGEMRYSGKPCEVMTKKVLDEIYGIDIGLYEVDTGERRIRVCIPRLHASGEETAFGGEEF